jgi:transcriptional regulator with XRE-family HTH domain
MTKELRIKIGAKIRAHRVAIGLTQLQLSKQLGYDSMMFVSLFERGHSQVPVKKLNKICSILKINKLSIANQIAKDFKQNLIKEMSNVETNI